MTENQKHPAPAGQAIYGREWSLAFLLAAIITAALWMPAYLLVNDNYGDIWWSDFAITFIVMAAVVTFSFLTCYLAKYREERQRKGAGKRNARS